MNYPPDTDSGTDGGAVAVRDLTNATGGGYKINCVNYSYTIVGKNVDGFEWNLYAQMDNYADSKPGVRREHCAFYSKANKFGSATNWAGVFEVHDHHGEGPCVGSEVDIWTKGEDNGSRIGTDYVVAGGNDINDPVASVGATAAVRCSAQQSNPLAYWSYGAMLRGIKEAGVQITSRISGAVRGVELLGKFIVGLDLSQAQCQSAIRLAPGQRMTFEPTDSISWSWLDGRLRVQNQGVNVIEIDTTTGDIYKRGVKVI